MNRIHLLSAVVLTIIAFVLLIYLTPLKHLNLVQPKLNDVTPAEFYARYQANPEKYVFIDVREASQYAEAHAQGAINMPIPTLFDGHPTLPKKGQTIVLICSGGRLSGVAYGFLEHQGFLNLERVEGGMQAWIAAGLPTE